MNKILSLSLVLGLALTGCMQEPVGSSQEPTGVTNTTQTTEAGVKKGILRVKLNTQVGNNFSVEATNTGLRSGQKELDDFFRSIGAYRMTRVFPYAGKYEARTRKRGLHLWYDIEFDDEVSTLRAASTLSTLPGVSLVEKLYETALPKTTARIITPNTARAATSSSSFNDPMLSQQWHYYNDGSGQRSVAGADINLYPAWEQETGKSNVVVAVIDGGIDFSHEDLRDNMHINQLEANGQDGVDDDNNGYVDDIYGYNFVSKSGKITAHKHGTHVAGTVAARNNNSLGVAGVAGGNGDPGSGIRLISCQTFAHATEAGNPDTSADGAPAMKYAADAGAIISQNSWGYTYPGPGAISPSMREAIDYFIENAGCDENGNQRADSPMKGGVVIFAAGNDYADYLAYPAAYERVIAVGSFGPDFKLTDYSNRGEWIDILAPGGNDWLGNGEVISTLPGNQYGAMVGTSMACPHVSGIAALVVSKLGKQGFTAEELKQRLLNSVQSRDVNAENPATKGRMGRGYIDALAALSPMGNKAPNAVSDVTVGESMTGLRISFKTVADEDDVKAISYKIYASTTPINESNYTQAAYTKEILAHFTSVGELLTHSLVNLDLNTPYYFAIVAQDRWGLRSTPYFFEGKTGTNQTPQVAWTEEISLVRISAQEVITRTLKVTEPDKQTWEYLVSGEQRGVSLKRSEEGLVVSLRAVAPVGIHRTTIKVIDIYGASAQTDLVFEVYKNTAPGASVKVIEMPTIFVPINTTARELSLADYFVDAEGDAITFTARTLTDASGATSAIEGSILKVATSKVGSGTIEITATDKHGATHRGILNVRGVLSKLVYRVYPVPATTTLNLDLKRPSKSATIEIRSVAGSVVLNKAIDAKSVSSASLALPVALDISKFSPGTYLLNVNVDGEKYSQPFVKQ